MSDEIKLLMVDDDTELLALLKVKQLIDAIDSVLNSS